MIHHSILFLAPEGSVPQATTTSPPAVQTPARRPLHAWKKIRFVAGVAGNAAGFGMLLAGCWFSLQLISVFVVT
ncbi:MAG: hypothetical protein PVI83_03570 [Lysobacterales bacterium]|jgi:hypothetical protein